jgi:hypothetical protein
MLRIWLIALALAAALVLTQQLNLVHRTGLVGYCATTAKPAGAGGYWRACHSGWLSGRPDLTRDSCKREGIAGRLEYWKCPEQLAAAPTG